MLMCAIAFATDDAFAVITFTPNFECVIGVYGSTFYYRHRDSEFNFTYAYI